MNVFKLFPGILLSILIALIAVLIENILPIHLVGGAVIAMFLGMSLNGLLGKYQIFSSGFKFTSEILQ